MATEEVYTDVPQEWQEYEEEVEVEWAAEEQAMTDAWDQEVAYVDTVDVAAETEEMETDMEGEIVAEMEAIEAAAPVAYDIDSQAEVEAVEEMLAAEVEEIEAALPGDGDIYTDGGEVEGYYDDGHGNTASADNGIEEIHMGPNEIIIDGDEATADFGPNGSAELLDDTQTIELGNGEVTINHDDTGFSIESQDFNLDIDQNGVNTLNFDLGPQGDIELVEDTMVVNLYDMENCRNDGDCWLQTNLSGTQHVCADFEEWLYNDMWDYNGTGTECIPQELCGLQIGDEMTDFLKVFQCDEMMEVPPVAASTIALYTAQEHLDALLRLHAL